MRSCGATWRGVCEARTARGRYVPRVFRTSFRFGSPVQLHKLTLADGSAARQPLFDCLRSKGIFTQISLLSVIRNFGE